MMSDAATSVGVLIAVGIVAWFDWPYADPIVAALISVMIVLWSVRLIRDSVRILLESAPSHIRLEDLSGAIRGVHGVADVHDLHIWVITSRMYMMSAHVTLGGDLRLSEAEPVARRIRSIMDERFDITHCTLEFESGAALPSGVSSPPE
jgi:cobalt-zinc-cadmium efflux system protein